MAKRRKRKISAVERELEAVRRRLRAEHPELRGVGIGFRVRAGSPVDELVVKLVVDRKYRRMPSGRRRLPEAVEMTIDPQAGRVLTPTDIEDAGSWTPSFFPVGRIGFSETTASALAAWKRKGQWVFGVITTGHGLTRSVGGRITVMANFGTSQDPEYVNTWGRVALRTEPRETGYDVGLVEVDFEEEHLIEFLEFADGPFRVIAPDEIRDWLAASAGGGTGIPLQAWNLAASDPVALMAYFPSLSVPVGGESVRFRSVVRCAARGPTFAPGTSGTAWSSSEGPGDDNVAVGLQSHANGNETQALGTTLHAALAWLRAQHGFATLRPFWTTDDLNALL